MDFNFIKLNKKLEGLTNATLKGQKVKDLHLIMRLPELWQLAYTSIYSNDGAITKGIDDVTLDGMSFETMEKIIKTLKEEKYASKPFRRTNIPKGDGKTRPLGLSSGDDKLVQSACTILIEQIYECIFHNESHGFRPQRSCHTALKQVKNTWTGLKWFIEFDIRGCFDNINHKTLMVLLKKRIKDERFCRIVWQFLKAGYIEDWKYHQTHSGVPQGGIISPLLSNVYLHELDTYIADLTAQFNIGKRRPMNNEYTRIMNRLHRLRTESRTDNKTEIRKLQKLLNETPSTIENTDLYKRMRYCRYADDFIIGIAGSYKDAETVMHSVKQFLKETLSLDIAPEKTQIQSSKKGIDFLGYTIKAQNGKRLIKMKVNGTHCRKRTTNGQILLSVPKEKIIGFVKDHKYGNLQEMESIHRGHYLNSSDVEIVEAYNSELRGFANYYNLARDVKSQLRPLMFLTHGSLTKTLASKHRISVAKVFARLKSGNELILQGQENGKNFKIKIFSLNHMKPSDKGYDEKPLTAHLYKQGTELTRRMTAEQCEYCGRTDRPMEVHHVKKLKDVKSKPNLKNWEKAMIARSRKTLILCAGSNESCHNLLHQGKLPDIRYTSDVDHT